MCAAATPCKDWAHGGLGDADDRRGLAPAAAGTFVPDEVHPAGQKLVTGAGADEGFAPEAGERCRVGLVPGGTYAAAVACGASEDPGPDGAPGSFGAAGGNAVPSEAGSLRDLFPAP